MEPKEAIAKLLSKETPLKEKEIIELLEVPKESELGDFAFPCFKLSSIFKKNPVEIAKQLQREIKLKEGIEKIESKGPYLNFFINKNQILGDILKAINKDYGKSDEGKNKKVVIDFSSPNVGKPMHVGHIRSTIIGDSLMRIHDFLGYNTIGINYLGDTGLHIGKLIVAWELWLNKKALKDDPVKEMLRLYVKFCELEKTEVVEGQDETDDYSNNEWTNKAKEKIKLIELGDEKTHKIWKEIRTASGKGFDRVYKMLNVKFNETTGQSKFGESGKELIIKYAKKGVVKHDSSGAMYIEFENLPKKFILRSNGTASYMTQDLGSAVSRYKLYKFDKMIYETDYRQSLHFQQLFAILKKFGYDFSEKCYHVGHGTVNFGKEILATRVGNIILLEDVLKKTIEKAKEEIKKRKTKGDAEAIGVASIKYAILRNEPQKDVEFSWDVALKFEGETGPYLQYSYARASSIIKKAGKTKEKLIIPPSPTKEEVNLAKKVEEFPNIVKNSAEKLDPSLIAHYSFSLAQTFNEFYHACPVIDSKEKIFRLKLVDAFRITLKNSLHILGIEVLEEM
ncbi:MAG: arginine--tRNA ligase [archaeon]|nr:arginine--tRNA ligase [archaeon]